MADTPVASFLAEIGFTAPDAKGARAVEDLVNRTETRITDVQARESDKRASAETKAQGEAVQRLNRWFAQRAEAESKANDDRARATAELFGDLLGLDKDQSAALLKHTRESSARTVQVEHDKAKKVSQIRAGQFKEASVDLLKFGAIAERIAGGLSGVLSAAPFGAFALSVERGAAGLAKLDIQAKRVGASASGIQHFLFAMKQQGVDEGEATGALEGFSSTMNSNPEGYRRALEGLPNGGVRTLDKDGKPLGRDEMLENFGTYLATQPFNIAKIQAGQFGITGDNAVRALQNPAGTRQGLQAYDAKLSSFGFDPNKAAEDARKVQQSWNNVEADFAIIRQKLDSEFFLPMMNSLDALAKKMEANPQTVENFGRALEALAIGVSARVLPTLANLLVKFTGLQAILGGSLGTALGVALNPVVALGASAESTPGAGVPADAAERAKVEAENKRLTDEANRKQGSSGSFWQDSWSYIKGKMGFGDDKKVAADIAMTAEGVKKLAEGAIGVGTGISPGGGGDSGALGAARRALGWAGRAAGYSPASGGGTTPAKGALAANQKEAYAAALKEGLSPTAARALVANMSGEGLAVPGDYHWDGTHMASGIVQWDPTRSAAIKAKFGAMPHQLSVADQTRAAIWEMKNKYPTTWHALQGDNAADMIGALVDDYERPGNRGRAKAQRMGYYRGFNPSPGTSAPATASSSPVGDQAALDAQKRIADGKGTPADHATIEAHREQQNTPVSKPEAWHQSPLQYTRSNGQNPLTELYKTGALKVEVTKPLPGLADTQKLIAQHLAKNPSAFSPHEMARGPTLSRVAAAAIHTAHTHNERHGDSFHIHGTDAKSGLDHAVKVSARREGQDRIRYGQR